MGRLIVLALLCSSLLVAAASDLRLVQDANVHPVAPPQ
jgi:hypothetical protein